MGSIVLMRDTETKDKRGKAAVNLLSGVLLFMNTSINAFIHQTNTHVTSCSHSDLLNILLRNAKTLICAKFALSVKQKCSFTRRVIACFGYKNKAIIKALAQEQDHCFCIIQYIWQMWLKLDSNLCFSLVFVFNRLKKIYNRRIFTIQSRENWILRQVLIH